MQQVKRLVRTKLAPWLRIRVPASKTSSTPTAVVCVKDNNDAGDFQQDAQQLQDMTVGRMDKLLTEIQRDLQRTRDGDKSADEDEENKNNWKLAAAVFDRFLLISFSILLTVGTAIFFIAFAASYLKSRPNGAVEM